MTNLVQFPGLGLSFEINRVALSIGRFNIYWYGVCIAFGICLALVFAFRHSIEFGVDPDSMVDVILIGIVLGIVSAGRRKLCGRRPLAYFRTGRTASGSLRRISLFIWERACYSDKSGRSQTGNHGLSYEQPV